MRLRVIKAFFIKEMIDIYKSKLITMPYIVPLLIVILFGYGIKMQVTGARVLLIDNDHSHVSRTLINKFEHSQYFSTTLSNMSEKEAMEKIKQATKDIIIIIPKSFEKNILRGVKSEIGVFIDASFPMRAGTMSNYVQGVVYSLTDDFHIKTTGVIELNNRNLFNQALRDEEMIVPGLIGLVLFVSPATLAALLIAKEKEKGTIFNFYSSSVSKAEFLFAKLSSIFLLESLNIFILFAVVIYLFDLPFRGSFAFYWLSSEIYIFISLSFGMLVSVLVSTQVVAVIISLMLTILPAFLYSGMLMPISSMSGEAYWVAHCYPVMYYNHIIYDAFLIGEGLDSSQNILYLFFLLGYGLILFALGMKFLKKEVSV